MQDKPSRADLRRAQVIAAARACFRRYGFHAASMAQIAAEADMSVGQIYRYFANKEAVIAAIVEQGVAEKIGHMAAIEAAARDNGHDVAAASAEIAGMQPADREAQLGQAALMLEIIAEAARNPTVACIVQRSDRQLRVRAEQLIAFLRPTWNAARVGGAVQVIAALYEGWYLRLVADPQAFDAEAERLRADLIAHILRA